MKPEEFEKLPIIGLRGTEGSDPTGYTEVQQFLLPYVDTYHSFLWLCFFGTLLVLALRFLILPLRKKSDQKVENKK